MGQLKHRFLLLGLSLLVLIIALAGLFSVLDTLPKPASSANQSAANPPSDNTSGIGASTGNTTGGNSGGGLVQLPDIKPLPIKLPDMNLPISLPDSFNLNVKKALDPSLSLKGNLPPHFPLFDVTGANSTQYLKSMTSSLFNGAEWVNNNPADFIPYTGELTIPPGIEPEQTIADSISVSRLADIINGNVAIPTALYPTGIDAPGPLLYNPDDMN